MFTYLQMWDRVKALNYDETLEAIRRCKPATGKQVELSGATFKDVDLLEALKNWYDNHPYPYSRRK